MPNRQSDDRNKQLPAKRAVGMILLFVGLIGLVTVLLCGCGIGAWVVWFASLINVTPEQWDQRVKEQAERRRNAEVQQATCDQDHAKAFLEYWLLLLEMKNRDELYRLTSKAFHERMTRQQFEDFIKARPYLKIQDHNWSHGVDGNPGDNFGFMLHSRTHGAVHTNSMLWVVREGGEWRLDKLEDGPNR
ncbi:MAG: hypothetical protein HY289_05985 [Planctomycetes bacterium]|nr:hypothetical protein [Planctomycetota bacterium]